MFIVPLLSLYLYSGIYLSPDSWGFVYLWDIWVLRDPSFSAKTKTHIRIRLGGGTLDTRPKRRGLTLKNGVDICTPVRLSAKITAWHRIYFVLVYVPIWALNLI